MPSKKITIPERMMEAQLENVARNHRPFKLIVVIMIILLLFGANVIYETVSDVQEKFEISESESKACLVDYQVKKCDTVSLTADCSKILDCVQKDR
jgi:Tfp pilus assembly protein PilO